MHPSRLLPPLLDHRQSPPQPLLELGLALLAALGHVRLGHDRKVERRGLGGKAMGAMKGVERHSEEWNAVA